MKSLIKLVLPIGVMALASCENPMTMKTKVNEDGSLEKTIIFEKADDSVSVQNIFGVSEAKGWALIKTDLKDSSNTIYDKSKFRFEFSRKFENADQANTELNTGLDTLFQIRSGFEKKFRWFYTYIRYTETIRPINRFKMVDPKDYFNEEDSSFISRLPAEGKTITKADSLYLLLLNEKISDHYATMGIFNETYHILEDVIRESQVEPRWLDSLSKKRESIYEKLKKDEGEFIDVSVKVFEELKIPVPKEKLTKDFLHKSKELESRIDFMTFARDGKYQFDFEMPWEIISTNADFVEGKKAHWQPLVHKFLFADYVMYAECRRMNLWTIAVSVIVVGATVLLYRRKVK